MKELIEMINKEYYLSIDGLSVLVIVQDVRKVWGRVDCRIAPIKGKGTKWVSADSLYIVG